MGKGFGSDPVMAQNVWGLMKKMRGASPEERKKIQAEIKDLQRPDIEKKFDNLADIKQSTEGALDELKNHTAILLTMAGEDVGKMVEKKRLMEQELLYIATGRRVQPPKTVRKEEARRSISQEKLFSAADKDFATKALGLEPELTKKEMENAYKIAPELFQTALETVLGTRIDALIKYTKTNKKSER
jgi:hypothetical protein